MKQTLYLGLAIALFFVSCTSQPTHEDTHSEETHEHEDALEEHDHADIKQELVAYTNDLELFAEADPFILNEGASILGHFTFLKDFKPIENAEISALLTVNGQTTDDAGTFIQAGIYEFDLHPETTGKGSLLFKIIQNGQEKQIQLDVIVFEDDHEAIEYYETEEENHESGISFTKEQSWKVEFATALPVFKPFGAVIKTTALVQPSPSKTSVLTAQTSGVINFTSANIVEGMTVNSNQVLFSITGTGMGDDNATIKYSTAKSNYEKEKSDYERVQKLAEKQIVSQKELLASKSSFEQAEAIYRNLQQNFKPTGQVVEAPFAGSISQIFVKNGEFIEAGQRIANLIQVSSMQLKADVRQKYASQLQHIKEVTIKPTTEKGWINLDELNGKLISIGTQVSSDNFLIPVYFEIENNGSFLSGSFVEVNLKIESESNQVVIPNTALIEQQGNYFVFVQIDPELFEKRQITIGESDGIESVVKNGLLPEERIVTKGAVLVKLASASGNLDPHAGHVH